MQGMESIKERVPKVLVGKIWQTIFLEIGSTDYGFQYIKITGVIFPKF